MNSRRLLRLLELALVLAAVALLARWGLRSEGLQQQAPEPSAQPSPPFRLAGISLEEDQAAVLKALGEPQKRSRVGQFQALEYRKPGQDGMTVVVLDLGGRVMSIMAEQQSLSLAGKVLIRPGDPPQSVEHYFGPPSQRTPDALTWRQVPRDATDRLLFGELTVHLKQGRVSQVVLVKNMLSAP